MRVNIKVISCGTDDNLFFNVECRLITDDSEIVNGHELHDCYDSSSFVMENYLDKIINEVEININNCLEKFKCSKESK